MCAMSTTRSVSWLGVNVLLLAGYVLLDETGLQKQLMNYSVVDSTAMYVYVGGI